MKELSIEEKAKRYDEALKQIKECTPDENGFVTIYPNEIFPELKESEDERIRKAIKYAIGQSTHSDGTLINGVSSEEALAWLEKQGEQNPAKWRQDNVEELTEFENVMMHIGSSFFGENAGLNPNDTTCIKEQANLLLELVPKQEWSKEDENIKESIITGLEMLKDGASNKSLIALYNKKIDWLKSLRPQNWTKEDKKRYISCLQRLSTGNPEQPETINSKWFKEHVYPQATWKPSDEQMFDLKCAADLNSNVLLGQSLLSLYNDLRKLKNNGI